MFLAFEMRMLLSLPTTVPIAKAIQLRKVGSSAWIRQTFRQLHNFSWQQGDGAFSVSVSQLPETITEALRAWLLSCRPSATKAIRLSKRHTSILALMGISPKAASAENCPKYRWLM